MINGVTRGHRQHILEKPKEPEIALCTTSLVAKPTGNGGLPVLGCLALPGALWPVAITQEPFCPKRGILGRDTGGEKHGTFSDGIHAPLARFILGNEKQMWGRHVRCLRLGNKLVV